ncbi:hypothetical protein M407DRAFT_25997 [Tulasnella calospora MUT 4182]|uniref:Uncharacterized protein n=1 Tax=Tulasnella calospora MUT 4182 TaxID=1051891 RepID=A0A0C3Q608_9AGAM|nr:hypothetical protein M407DRAFT_25997 [Tulasnella calospora MUT 4182]
MASLSPTSSPETYPAILPSPARSYPVLSVHEKCTVQVLKSTDDGFLQIVLPFARPKHAIRTEVSLTIEKITKTDDSRAPRQAHQLGSLQEESPTDGVPKVPATERRKNAAHRLAKHWRSTSNLRAKASISSLSSEAFEADGAHLMEVLRQRSQLFHQAQARYQNDK